MKTISDNLKAAATPPLDTLQLSGTRPQVKPADYRPQLSVRGVSRVNRVQHVYNTAACKLCVELAV